MVPLPTIALCPLPSPFAVCQCRLPVPSAHAVCAAVGVIIVANVQLAAVKRPVSAALSRLAVAKKRSELTKLRSRVLGDEGHRATRRSVLKRSCLRITLACCDCVTPKPVWRLRAFLRTITHDLRYRTWMA